MLLLSISLLLIAAVYALPAPTFSILRSRQLQGLPGIGDGPATAPDGTPILEDEVNIGGLPLRFKVSAPANALIQGGNNNGNGNRINNKRQANLGINVLLHGDGGQSFFDFPNAGVSNGLIGVALLAPDANLRWGGQDNKDNTGLIRPDGQLHSSIVNNFITQVLPQMVSFDNSQIFFEGVSGGSLTLSGFTIPQFGASLGVRGVVFGCGGLPPQINVQGDISNLRIHWQSSVNELVPLQTSIPQSIVAYEQNTASSGASANQINQLLTADNSPNGGHCEFDQQDFVSGVQLLTDNFANVIGGNARLNGVQVVNGVAGNEDLFNNGAANGNNNNGNTAANVNAAAGGGRGRNRNN